jgi:hypothetical protein
MNQAATTDAPAYDPWDSTGQGMWYLKVEPTTVAGLWSEEQDTLYIYQESDGYWMTVPGRMGQSQFATLDEAKKAGTEFWLAREAAQPANMLRDAGLDAGTWSFEYQEGARFRHLSEEGLVIEIKTESDAPGNPFEAFSGDDSVGTYEEASQAAEALVNRPAPGI